MSPLRRWAVVTTIVAGLCAGVRIQAADNLVLSRFGDYIEALRMQTAVPGLAALIVGTTDVAWERAFGHQDVDRLVTTRTDTPFHFDMITQTLTASLTLQCVQAGKVSLDDRIEQFVSGSSSGNATIRQVLTHTLAGGGFSYQPQRLDALKSVVEKCHSAGSFRASMASLLERFAMVDSVPGPDAVAVPASTTGIGQAAIDRYGSVLTRLATPYAVDPAGRATKSTYSVKGLTAGSGLISTARDYARFDVALKTGAVIGLDTLATAWTPATGGDGRPLPHGMGWFVQSYGGEKVVWQFGQSDNASSSLLVILPARGLSLVLLANSDGLSKSLGLADGDVTRSPFARVFLELFVR